MHLISVKSMLLFSGAALLLRWDDLMEEHQWHIGVTALLCLNIKHST